MVKRTVSHGFADKDNSEITNPTTSSNYMNREETDETKNHSHSLSDFTGQHRCILNTPEYKCDLTGLIVRSTGKLINNDNTVYATVNESLPIVDITTQANDKRVFGVISSREDENAFFTYGIGNFYSKIRKFATNDNRVHINSVGEGGMWVCNSNGSLKNGDYITSARVNGYGMKQSSTMIHNYTVAENNNRV